VTRAALVRLLREHRLAVVATVAADGAPQSAVVGCAISDALEIVFDTLADTRKARNLRRDPRVSVVIGWDREATAQIEGLADFPAGAEGERLRAVYFQAHPDGRERLAWPGITHVRVRPRWIRWSDFARQPPFIFEAEAARLA
jgi:PPOX class probable F420-dependent enzyme